MKESLGKTAEFNVSVTNRVGLFCDDFVLKTSGDSPITCTEEATRSTSPSLYLQTSRHNKGLGFKQEIKMKMAAPHWANEAVIPSCLFYSFQIIYAGKTNLPSRFAPAIWTLRHFVK